MTAHRTPHPQEPPEVAPPRLPASPSLSANSADQDDQEDDDDRLSLSSSDMDASWLQIQVTPDVAEADSMTASAFGSSTISDMAVSDRTSEPSERGDETDGWALSSDAGSELHTDAEVHSGDEAEDHLATPGLLRNARPHNPDTEAFQRSFIFPDPHSPSHSFSSSWTSTTGTVVDATPQRSLANIRTEQPWRDSKAALSPLVPREVERPSEPTLKDDEPPATPKSESFRAAPPSAGRRWSMMACIVTLFVILDVGPTADLAAVVLNRFSLFKPSSLEAGPTLVPDRTWLATATVHEAREAITSLSTRPASSRKDVAVTTQTPTEVVAWSHVIRKKAEAVTDFIIIPQTSFDCRCPPRECSCLSLPDPTPHIHSAIVLLDDYMRWTSQFIRDLYLSAVDYLAQETEAVKGQIRHYQDMAALFVQSEPVRAAVEQALVVAATSQEKLRDAYKYTHERVCANDRCDRAVVRARAEHAALAAKTSVRRAARNARRVATAARRRGFETAARARLGLDNAIRFGQGKISEAAAEAATRFQSTSTKARHPKTKEKGCRGRCGWRRGTKPATKSKKQRHAKTHKAKGKCGRVRVRRRDAKTDMQ